MPAVYRRVIPSRHFYLSIRSFRNIDKLLLIYIMSIVLFGMLMVYDASVFYANQTFGGKYHFLILQGAWVTIGIIGAFIMSIINLDIVKKYSGLLFIVAIAILAFILLPTPFAPSIYGARRWFYFNPSPLPKIPGVGVIGFQPSEFAKLAGIIFGAAYFSGELPIVSYLKSKTIVDSKTARNFIFIVFVSAGLIAIEPDFDTALMFATILLSLCFVSDAPLRTLVQYLSPIAILAGVYAVSSKYRMDRIMTLFDPDSIDKLGAGYHIRQIMIALGSGGFLGLGFGNSRQKYAYLPEVIGDSIFAVIGEEFGFVGAAIVIALFMMLIGRCFYIAERANGRFEALLVKGIAIWISLQALINLLAMVRLIPLTGVPLPLVSYGGSSTIFMLLGLGLILNVSKNIAKTK